MRLMIRFFAGAGVEPSRPARLDVYFRYIVGPIAVPLGRSLCRTHGAVLNIDFSASDAKQQLQVPGALFRRLLYFLFSRGGIFLGRFALRPLGCGAVRRKRKRACSNEPTCKFNVAELCLEVGRRRLPMSARRRTYGGVTGLSDVMLLPPLYTNSENRRTIEVTHIAAVCPRKVSQSFSDPMRFRSILRLRFSGPGRASQYSPAPEGFVDFFGLRRARGKLRFVAFFDCRRYHYSASGS
jgi:hypothetical protein